MKINKIICDHCDKEIDIDRDNGLAAFEYILSRPKISFDPSAINADSQMRSEDEIVKKSFDLCKKCADIIVEIIEKKQEATKDNKEVKKDK